MSADKAVARGIVLLCQGCKGDLRRTGQEVNGHPLFECGSCGEPWVYTPAGWEPAPVSPRR